MNISWTVRSLAIILTLVAPSLWAMPEDETPAAPKEAAPPKRGSRPGDVQRVFVVNHVNVNDLARLLSVFPAEISGADRGPLHALSVSAAPAVVAAIEETIKRLDVPGTNGKSVEVTGYVLECSTKEPGATPADLQDVVAQLKRTFNYAGCGLAQTLFARGTEGNHFQSRSRDNTPTGNTDLPTTYSLAVDGAEIDASQPSPRVRLRMLSFNSNGGGHGDTGFNGSVAIRDGQRVVLGKLTSGESGKDQVLVLAAKVVD